MILLNLFLIAVILAQGVYWCMLRDEDREQVVWNACLHPGAK